MHQHGEGLLRSTWDVHLTIKTSPGDSVEALSENLLEVFRIGELEEDSCCSFGETEAASEVEFVTNVGSLVQTEVVGRCEKKSSFSEEPSVVAEFAVVVVVLAHRVREEQGHPPALGPAYFLNGWGAATAGFIY